MGASSVRRWTAALVLLCTGCGLARTEPARRAGEAMRPGSKETCSEATLTALPADVWPSDRELVPLRTDLLGVEATYSDETEERVVVLVSGGYLDDVLEAYDDLAPMGGVAVRGSNATVLAGEFLGQPAHASYWREGGIDAPCDVHAVLSRGLTSQEFQQVLAGLE